MAMPPRAGSPDDTKSPVDKPLGWLKNSGRNVLELLVGERMASPDLTPHRVVHTGTHFRLRRYQRPKADDSPQSSPPQSSPPQSSPPQSSPPQSSPPLLLVPPLMVTAEIYDVSPELSAVGFLLSQGTDVWAVDFGAPEHEQGGLERTLDDHLLAVDEAVDEVARRTGEDVHLLGYSQGGIFVYQVAAYRHCQNVASVITMGTPVDMHKNLPVRVHDDLVERSTRAARDLLQRPLELIDSLPGELTSLGFKLFSIRKELDQYLQLLTILPDRAAVARWRSRRQFLGGGGFVAWPGPALRNFIDEVLVGNRLTSGGFVVNGHIITLSDITCPVLCFVGLKDDLAFAPAVRAIHRAAPRAQIEEVGIRAGHFGLVVGSKAFGVTWPSVVSWVAHGGQLPSRTDSDSASNSNCASEPDATNPSRSAPLAKTLWNRLGRLTLELSGLIEVARWERPRLARLADVHTRLAFGPAFALARTANESPDDTFFLWRDHAFTYWDAHERVQQLATRLYATGVRQNHRVGLRLGQTPDFLSALCALSWLGAEIQPTASATAAEPNLASAPKLDHLFDDLTAIPAAGVAIPNHQRPLPTAPALDLRAPTQPGAPLRLNNRAWAAAYLHTAAVCHLKPADTLYAGLPLHHPLALLCALPPALIARTRLALGAPIPPEGLTTPTSIQSFSTSFWQDVRRYGASVVFLTRAMTTALLAAPPDATDRNTPVRCAILFDTPTNAARPAHDLTHRFGIPLIISAQLAPDFPAHPSPLILTPLHE